MSTVSAVPLPRSFLYVPGTRPELFAKAAAGPADAVVLDLEDAVPADGKAQAREAVRDWLVDRLGDGPDHAARTVGNEQWVRVDAAALAADLDAVVRPGLAGIVLATCSVAALDEVSRTLDRLEPERDMAPGSVGVVGLVEDAAALLSLAEMATRPRLRTFGIGEVDLLGDLRMARTVRSAPALAALRTQVVVHCAAAGLAAPVAPTSTDFRDLDAFAASTQELSDLGFRSRTAIHPGQVPVIHRVLTPDRDTVARARDVMARFEQAGGGVTTDAEGRFIDAAVVRGARETLGRHRGPDA